MSDKLSAFNNWIRQRLKWTHVKRFSLIIGFLVLGQGFILRPLWKADLHPSPINNNLRIIRERVEVVYSSQSRKLSTGCQLPKLSPLPPSLRDAVQIHNVIVCRNKGRWPLLFSSPATVNPVLQKVNDPEEFGFQNCCYHPDPLGRGVPHKNEISKLDALDEMNCNPLTENTTQIPKNFEFIAVLCQQKSQNRIVGHEPKMKLVDMFAFTPPRLPKFSAVQKGEGSQKLNVLVFGIDCTSHMNFLRNMPRSYLYLTQNLSAVGMDGFTSLEANTLANVVPMLTGISAASFHNSCYPLPHSTPDNCYFIWQNFTRAGYLTSYAEDAFWMSFFKYKKKSFTKPPVDYYFQNFASLLDKAMGHSMPHNANMCYGPRLGFVILLNYIKRLAVSLPEKIRYFQFVWSVSLSHDDADAALIGDDHLLRTLKWFHEKGYLEKTALFLVSDHGARYGRIRHTEQGKLEERMPFLYMLLPKWFQEKYPLAIFNYHENRNKLTTAYDFHETLKDFLTPNNLTAERIKIRSKNFNTTLPRGISLFLPIPSRRTCADAHIPPLSCLCFPTVKADLNDPDMRTAARAMVAHINQLVKAEPVCAVLEIDQITGAEHRVNSSTSIKTDQKLDSSNILNSIITLTTKPGGAMYEGSLSKDNGWKVLGSVRRINAYHGQDFCMDQRTLKPYCFCIPAV